MSSRLVVGTSALALAAAVLLTSMSDAQAQRRWRGGPGPFIGGLAAGAIIGGALAARPYYGPGYYYGPGPGYYYGPPAPAYAEPGGDDVAYCMSRFKSYDPNSGTYLGYDGLRRPCP